MNLIPLNDNLLINPDKITSVELKLVRGKQRVVVKLDGDVYILDYNLTEFLKNVSKSGADLTKQFTAV